MILWFFLPRYIQLLPVAFLLGQLSVCMGLYPVLRRRDRATTGIYLGLFSLVMTATVGFVLLPEAALASFYFTLSDGAAETRQALALEWLEVRRGGPDPDDTAMWGL